MTDRPRKTNSIARELIEAEALEALLSSAFASLQPPVGATQRLLAKLDSDSFHESQLTLDADAPYSFEEALQNQALAQPYEGSDLLAAGLEEEPIDEDELDPDDEE